MADDHVPLWRTILAWFSFAIAALLLPVSLVAHWGARTITDTDRYVDTVAPLASDPEIQAAVSALVVDQLEKGIQLPADIEKQLPARVDKLVPAVEAGVAGFLGTQVDKLLASDRFEELWADVNRRLQQQFVRLLEGDDSGALSITGEGQVVLDTGVVVEQVKEELDARGVPFVGSATVPPRADRDLVLMSSSSLAAAQDYYSLMRPVAMYVVVVVFGLLGLAVLLSGRRSRMVIAIGIASIATGALVGIGWAVGRVAVEQQLNGTALSGVSDDLYETLTTFLRNGILVAFSLGAVMILAGWLGGRSTSGTAIRKAAGARLRSAGHAAGEGSLRPVVGVGTTFSQHIGPIRVAIITVAIVSIALRSLNTANTILWTTALTMVALAAAEFLRGIGEATTGGPPEMGVPV